MITVINENTSASTLERYKKLFAEASDLLRGYKQVRTYESNTTYYTKNIKAETLSDMFKNANISERDAFVTALAEGVILYKKIDEPYATIDAKFGINTLEEYFANLGEIKERGGEKYTVLPLDEDYFEINANTRAIIIPASFKKNGIAVQSDDLAEVIYFKVDRYFDYTDLNTCEIFIQWETPKGPGGTVVQSADRAYIKDIESEPGKLIFGWVLDKDITAFAGNLKFSVRFVKWSGGSVAYSLSTLTASATIQPSINFELKNSNIQIDDAGKRLLDRIENGQVIGQYAAAQPEFILNLNSEYDCNEDGEIDFAVLAVSTDNGLMTYKYIYKDLEGYEYEVKANRSYKEVEKELILDERFDYYTDTDLTQPLSGNTLTEEQIEDDEFHVYIEAAFMPWDKLDKELTEAGVKNIVRAGSYWVVASNRITNSTTKNSSNIAIAPQPEDITFAKDGQLPAAGIFDEDNAYTATVTLSNSDTRGITYQWYKVTWSETDKKYTKVLISGATDKEYSIEEEGIYGVEIKNTRNLMVKTCEIDKEENPPIKVTLPAQEPEISHVSSRRSFNLAELHNGNNFRVNLDMTDIPSDGVVVEWWFSETSENGETASGCIYSYDLKKQEDSDIYDLSFNPFKDEDIMNAIKTVSKKADGIEDFEGRYYPVIKNYYNNIKEIDGQAIPPRSIASVTFTNIDDQFSVVN